MESSGIASAASATPAQASVEGRSPAARPNSTGTHRPTRLNTGDARLMGPSASDRYMSDAPAAPHAPAAAPHRRSAPRAEPGMNGMAAHSSASAPTPEKQATSGAGARLAATPPRKSAEPQRSEEAAPIA